VKHLYYFVAFRTLCTEFYQNRLSFVRIWKHTGLHFGIQCAFILYVTGWPKKWHHCFVRLNFTRY